MPDQCSTCFYGRIVGDDLKRYCFSQPPMGPWNADLSLAWREVTDDFWCGHYSATDPDIYQGYRVGPEGPPGPTVVSVDTGNLAELGSDGLLFVPPVVTKTYVDTQDAKLQSAIETVAQNLVFIGQINAATDTAIFTSASGLTSGHLPVASIALRGRYVIVTVEGTAPAGSHMPPGTYARGDWIVCDSAPAWNWLQLGRTDVTASDVGVIPAINALTDVQSVLAYLDSKDAVSANAGNLARLGTDNLVMVPDTSVLKGVTNGTEAAPGTIGEYKVTSNTTGVNMSSNIATQVCPISLTAGDWEIWGSVDFTPPSSVSPNMIAASVSVHPNQLPNEADLMTGVGILNMFTTTALTSGQRQVLMTGTCRSNSAASLNLYLVAQTMFNGTGPVIAKGYICARRAR